MAEINDNERAIATSEIEKRASEISQGRTGEEMNKDISESPLDEARRLNKETKDLLQSMTSKKAELDKVLANNMIAGRAEAGKENRPKTQADFDKEAADKMLAQFGR